MTPEWSAAVQGLIVAVCTWYVRRGNKKDSESNHCLNNEIIDRLSILEVDVALIKQATLRQPMSFNKGDNAG